jgi:hypothetical protein
MADGWPIYRAGPAIKSAPFQIVSFIWQYLIAKKIPVFSLASVVMGCGGD